MQKQILLLIYLLYSFSLVAQKEDNNWMLGYNTQVPAPLWGGMNISFQGDSINIKHQDILRNFTLFNTSISDKEGNLLFYSEGTFIMNKLHKFMENGDSINFQPYIVIPPIGADTQGNGYGQLQGGIIIPKPGNDSIYLMFHSLKSELYEDFYKPLSLLKTTINIKANKGLGKVVSKNISIKDLKYLGSHVNAVKHANGRDWWILNKRDDLPEFFTFLQTPDTLIEFTTQAIGSLDNDNYGQHYFSPDGTKFAYSNIGPTPYAIRIHILDFDRCTGILSNERFFSIKDSINTVGGLCFSPNNRFLYFTSQTELYQADLNSAEIIKSIKLIDKFDFNAYNSLDSLLSSFFMMVNAPDGKIYINAANSSRWFHVINQPEREGKLCDFRKFAVILLHYNFTTFPNFPNFRLGPVDGSTCDTLGINNYPVANFNFQHTDNIASHFDFVDLSYHDPQVWKWDFGDGTNSSEQYPTHNYKTSGDYEVCLTVSNQNGSDTKCKFIYALYTDTYEPILTEKYFNIFPNPVAHTMVLEQLVPVKEPVYFNIYNALGQLKFTKLLWGSGLYFDFNMDFLASGVYFYTITSNILILQNGKLLKL